MGRETRPPKTRYTWHYLAAGYAAVWATANTREAIWDAMKRREVYGTSGSRITLRFFGGWDFERRRALALPGRDRATRRACRWAATCAKAPAGAKAPTFLVAAMKDPRSGNLDRIQIVKGWLDKNGKGQEKVYDVVWGDAHRRTHRRQRQNPDAVWLISGCGQRHLGQHDRRPRAVGRLDRPRLRSVGAGLLLRARHRDPDAALDGATTRLRFGIKMPPEVPMTAPGAGLGIAHLVHAGALKGQR